MSVFYRVQYWQSTAALIRDHALFGCGPGNFQSVYPTYKLPEASEEIGDPHNFLLEVAATMGVPVLLLFVGLLFLLLRGLKPSFDPLRRSTASSYDVQGYWLLGGAILGIVLTLPLAYLSEGSLATVAEIDPTRQWNMPAILGMIPWMWLIGLPIVVVGFFALSPLLDDDVTSLAATQLAGIILLVNLLAAGGIGFPNVNLPLALLLALCCPIQATTSAKGFSYAALAGAAALLLGCYFTCYGPTLRSQAFVARATERAEQGEHPLDEIAEATAADPWNAQLSIELGHLELQRFVDARDRAAWQSSQAAFEEAVRRNPRSHAIHRASGHAHLAAFHLLGEQELVARAIQEYALAVDRYPNFSVLHAELAWAQHVAGNEDQARKQAHEALRLDELCPHADKKLVAYRLTDSQPPADLSRLPLDQVMQRLTK